MYGTVHTAEVTVNHKSYHATDGDAARAHERAARDAVIDLELHGYQRPRRIVHTGPRRHYRTEINNIGIRHGWRVEYDDVRRGPPQLHMDFDGVRR